MADKIVVLNKGRIEQVGSPLELYRNPANRFVAEFIGSPKMNIITGAPAAEFDASALGVRPEHLSLSTSDGTWQGTVAVSEHLGSDTFLHIDVADIGKMTVRAGGEIDLNHGDTVHLTPDPDRLHRFDAGGNNVGV